MNVNIGPSAVNKALDVGPSRPYKVWTIDFRSQRNDIFDVDDDLSFLYERDNLVLFKYIFNV
jgi:hypothetical protein